MLSQEAYQNLRQWAQAVALVTAEAPRQTQSRVLTRQQAEGICTGRRHQESPAADACLKKREPHGVGMNSQWSDCRPLIKAAGDRGGSYICNGVQTDVGKLCCISSVRLSAALPTESPAQR